MSMTTSGFEVVEYPVKSIDVEGGRRNLAIVNADSPATLVMLINDYDLLVDGCPANLNHLKAWFATVKDARLSATHDFGRYGHVVKAEFFS
jgi:hypothetical protein